MISGDLSTAVAEIAGNVTNIAAIVSNKQVIVFNYISQEVKNMRTFCFNIAIRQNFIRKF